jgi:hypothetical protein
MDKFGAINLKSVFSFFKGTTDLGVGTRDLGFRRSQTLPVNSVFLGNTGRREWNVRRSLGPISGPGYMKLEQQLVPVTIRGSGLGVAGQYELQSLAIEEGK